MKLFNVSKNYSDNTVLNEIKFEFGVESIVGLVGKNGEGKTTLMKILIGNIVNFDGEFEVDKSKTVGYLIEHPKLYENRTGYYNLKAFSQIIGDGYDRDFAEFLIKSFDMHNYINKKVKSYSLGMKQKLSIAISLINKPQFLILDEPTNGMDPDGSIDVLNTIKDITNNRGMKVLISSHKLEDVELICDRVLFLQSGKFIKDIDIQDTEVSTVTIIEVKKGKIDKACDILKHYHKIIDINKENGEIKVSYIQDYEDTLEKLSKENIYPLKIETKKDSLRDTYFKLKKEEVPK